MGRGKTISDPLLLDRLLVALIAHGPSDLSFAKASDAAGLAAATLVQRFGSRENMVEAILNRAWDQMDEATALADAGASADPAGAIELLSRLTKLGGAEVSFGEGLTLLREDIRNPVLRARGAAWGARLAYTVGRRLCSDEHRAGQLGWQMVSLWQGVLVWWAFQQDVDLDVRVREALEDWCRTIGVR